MISRDQMVEIQSFVVLRFLQSGVTTPEEIQKVLDLMLEKQLRVLKSTKDSILQAINNTNKFSPEVQAQMREVSTSYIDCFDCFI